MKPIFFEGRFGWLHEAADGTASRMGVALCPAYAQEEICTHYGLMLLADALAAAGMPTLRFDYRGTGDSADVDVTLATLADDVARAVDCLRQESGVGPVALCGLRLGSAVAAHAAANIEDVVGVAMLAPVVAGKTFLRATRAAAGVSSLALLDPVPKADAGLPLNTNGFLWSGALQNELSALDLIATPSPAQHVLLATIRSDRQSPAYAERLREQGVSVVETPFTDYEAYVQDPTTHTMPDATFAAVVAWADALPRHADTRPAAPAIAPSVTPPVVVTPTLVDAAYEEIPTLFGPDGAVFGMLCRPAGGKAASVAALLLHEGSSTHIGNGRAYVALARDLAAHGIASLRMDLTGMGDSNAGANTRSPYYDPERLPEALAGLDRLAAAGHDRAVAFGLCSGADAAWKVGLTDDRVVGIFMINLQKFIWHYGDDLRIVARNSKRTIRSYARSMRNPAEWRRALSGKADLIGIARVLGRRGVTRGVHALRNMLPPAPGSTLALVREQLRGLAERRVHTLLVFSDEDPGLGEMAMHFGRGARGLKAFAPARLAVMHRADHHFNGTDIRRRYRAMVTDAMHEVIAEHGNSHPGEGRGPVGKVAVMEGRP